MPAVWTTPRTWVAGETVTATIANSAWRDNLMYLKDSPTFDGNATITGTLTQTGVATLAAAPVLSALTASLPVFTNGSKALTSNAMTGTGSVVMSTSPTLVTPILGTPTSGTLTNCTGLPISTGVSGLGSNVATFLATPSSANLAAALTDETGTGANVFATSPTLVTPILGTPTSGTLTNCTGLPISTGVSGLASNVATFLATPSSANLAAALTDETGTGAAVFATSPTLVTPALGTPASGTLTNCTGLPAASVVAGTFGAGAFTFPSTLAVTGVLTVSGFGTHAFSAGGTGTNRLSIRNTLAGSANLAQLAVVDDTGYDTSLTRFASTYTSSGPNQANGTTLLSEGPGGLSIQTSHASGEIRFYSGGSTERARFTSGGAFSIGGDLTFADAIAGVNTTGNISTTHLMALKATTNGTGGTYLVFENAAGSVVGKIYQATTTTTAYVTSSDARLKTDLGVADDLSALRALRIHDFAWKDNGVVGRNVFAQEALMVSPRGVKPGDDSRTATGELANPWMFDRLEYVPDLIVGWQQHEARLAALEARLKEQ